MTNGQFNGVITSCAKDAGSQSDLLLSSSTTPCSHPACHFTAGISDPEPTVLQNQLVAGPAEPLPQVRLGKGKQEALCRLCRVILNATMPNLGAALTLLIQIWFV